MQQSESEFQCPLRLHKSTGCILSVDAQTIMHGSSTHCHTSLTSRHLRGVIRATLTERCGEQIRCECNGVMRLGSGEVRAMVMERMAKRITEACRRAVTGRLVAVMWKAATA